MMPLTMRPTGGHSPVYADRQEWTIHDDGEPVGRIYEDVSVSTSADQRWVWSVTVYADPKAGIVTSGKVATPEEAKAQYRYSSDLYRRFTPRRRLRPRKGGLSAARCRDQLRTARQSCAPQDGQARLERRG